MNDNKRFKYLKVHVTGYGAFGKILTNPTTVLVNKIKENLIEINNTSNNFQISSAEILKVAWSEAEKYCSDIHKSFENEKDEEVMHLFVHFGVASMRSNITIERIARNCNSGPDVDGICRSGNITEICSDQYECRLNVNKIIESLLSKGNGHVGPSDDAGDYLCNYIYFTNESKCKINKLDNVFCVFIHMPLFEVIEENTQYKFFHDFLNEVREIYLN